MQMIKCEHGHIFDADKFVSCPHCANSEAKVKVKDIMGTRQSQIDTAIPHEGDEAGYEAQITRKTVGWLVCLNGSKAGTSYALYEGENAIGRSSHMDVALTEEATVSRENHIIITYFAPAKYLLETTRDNVYCNNKPIRHSYSLKGKTHIQIGDCRLLFVPLCDSHFSWYKTEY